VIWTSDNGAPIAKNSLKRGSNLPLAGSGYTTAEGAFRVPTIMWWPGKVPAGTVADQLTTTMDLLPTFARLAQVEPPQDRNLDGYDIRPILFGQPQAKSPYEAFYYYEGSQLQAIRSGPWKLFLPLETFANHPHFKRGQPTEPLLFNVVEDISSQHNVAEQHPDIVKRLTALAEIARQDLGDTGLTGQGQRTAGFLSVK